MVQCVEKDYWNWCRWFELPVKNICNHHIINVKGTGLHKTSRDILNAPCQNFSGKSSVKSLIEFIQVEARKLNSRLARLGHNSFLVWVSRSLNTINYTLKKHIIRGDNRIFLEESLA